MRCHLILNPKARGGKSGRLFETIFRLMDEEGLEYDFIHASNYESIHDASVKAHHGNADAIIAVGGDGTINATINGFFNEEGTLRSDKMMGVIYTGTSPDFCKSYGVPLDLREAVRAIRTRAVRKIRVGKIQLRAGIDAYDMTTRYFSCCASIGIGAMVAGRANRFRKYLGDTAGTFASILSSLMTFHPADMVIHHGFEEHTIPRVTNVFVGRTKYIASGLQVQHEIADDDSRFYILCAKNLRLTNLPGLLRQLYTGDISDSPVLEVMHSDRVSVHPDGIPVEVEFDGDPAGFTPCSIEAAPDFIRLIVRQL